MRVRAAVHLPVQTAAPKRHDAIHNVPDGGHIGFRRTEVPALRECGAVSDEGTLCAVSPASPKFCTFNLALCHNEPGCTVGKLKKRVHATGHCNPAKLTVSPTDSSCGAFTGIKVRTRGNGKKPGKCRIRVGAKSSDKPAMTDVDKVLLTCMPAGTSCP